MKFEETEENITLHGLGFLQVKLQGNQRLHVWHPSLPRRRCFEHSAIHDHRFGFVSRVIVGMIDNTVYSRRNADDHAPATHISYLHEGARTQFGNRPWIPDEALIIREDYRERVPAGQEYLMAPYVYHRSDPVGGIAATIMRKTEEHKRGAHSLCVSGIEPDVDFDRKQWPDEALWDIVRRVLAGKS